MAKEMFNQSEEVSRPDAAIQVFRFRLTDAMKRSLSTGAGSLREVRVYEYKLTKKDRTRKKPAKPS